MICPKCGANVPDGPECIACGVIVDKFKARAESRGPDPVHTPATPLSTPSSKARTETAVTRKLSDKKQIAVYRQLARMLDAGLSPTEALHLMARSTKGRLASAMDNIRLSIEHGSSFAQAALGQAMVFPESSYALLQAGEATGTLPAALNGLASTAEIRLDVKRQIVRACIYPFVLFTLVFFIPKAYLLFTVGFWGYFVACAVPYVMVLGVLIAGILLLPKLVSRLLGKELTSRFVRSVPGLRGLYRLSSRATFMGHLGAGLASGLPIASCLRLAASATSDPAWINAMDGVQKKVESGSTLHDALSTTGLLDEDMLLSVASGERVGRLDESLKQEASLLQSSFLHRLNISIQILSIFILLATYAFVAGAVVGEYEDVMDGAKGQLDQVMKEVGGGGSGDLGKLLKSLKGGGDMEKLLKGLDGAQGNDIEKLLKELNHNEGNSGLPPELKGILK